MASEDSGAPGSWRWNVKHQRGAEHDAATEALCRVIEARDGTGDNPLAVLETLSRSEAISKWQALHDKIVGLAEVLRTGLPDYTSGDGSVRVEHEDQDAYFKVEDGYLSRFRRAEPDIGEGPTSFPSDVAVYLMECSAGVTTTRSKSSLRATSRTAEPVATTARIAASLLARRTTERVHARASSSGHEHTDCSQRPTSGATRAC